MNERELELESFAEAFMKVTDEVLIVDNTYEGNHIMHLRSHADQALAMETPEPEPIIIELTKIVTGAATAPAGPVHVVGHDVLVQAIQALVGKMPEPVYPEMGFRTFMRLAREYNNLGSSVQHQLDELLNSEEPIDDMNPNALELIRKFIANAERAGVSDDYSLQDLITDHLGD